MFPMQLSKNIEEDPAIVKELENILAKRRGYVFKPPKNESIVFIISGGLDSSIILERVLDELQCTIYPMYVERGAKAEPYEKESVEKVFKYYREKFGEKIKDIFYCKQEVPPKSIKKWIPSERLKSIGHPMRNAVLQSLGVQYAVSLNESQNTSISNVFTATSPDDTFPHSSLLALRLINMLICTDNGDWRWQVTSPLLEPELWGKISKKDSIVYAIKNGFPLINTRTCTSGGEKACGVCPECSARKKAFVLANIEDPIDYEK